MIVAQFEAVVRDPAPVSGNKLYGTARGGRRYLTSEGKAYKAAVKTAVSDAILLCGVVWKIAVDSVYKNGGQGCLEITVWFPELYNPTWTPGGGKTSTGNSRSPFTKKDVSNYVKITEDGVVEGTGIDDSANMFVSGNKQEDPVDPRVVIRYTVFE